MINIFKVGFRLSQNQRTSLLASLQGVLSPHILRILEQDSGSAKKYAPCIESMSRIVQKHSVDQAKTKCNLLFSAHSLSDSLLHLRPILSNLIVQGELQSQYELDQLVKWLTKEIKINNGVNQSQIRAKLAKKHQQAAEFQQQLQRVEKQQNQPNLNALCKWFRDKYTTLDSKIIFQCVSKLVKSRQCQPDKSKKDNKFWDKILDIKPRQLKLECNPKEVYEQHIAITQGKLRFRFPPEPNGYLHIGHLKSMRINFESAIKTGGVCYLRYDDTNPQKQTHEFIEEIEQNIKWLGYTPDKISFASDYFEELEQFAHQLIQNGHAYVCDSPQEEIELERKNKTANPYRGRTKEQSLKIFPNLAFNQTLRLKGNPAAPNPTLRDPIIYRRKKTPHPRTGSKFKIYPNYDFAHCTCDSLQHIDYSLCSLEFEVRRELYYTFLDLLGLWKPIVWEYSRLNIEGNVLSKRKIKDFIQKGVVEGWDDPRLLTIKGLINRGYTPEMLKEFIDKVNCSRAGNENYVQYSLLQQEMKKSLLISSPRAMAVLQPFAVKIINSQDVVWKKNSSEYDQKPEMSLFIENADASKMSSGQTIILKNAGAFSVKSKTDSEITLNYLGEQNISSLRKSSPQIKIVHWVNEKSSRPFKTVLYDRLLTGSNQINPHSKTEYMSARIPLKVLSSQPSSVQFQRIGFFKFHSSGQYLQLCTKL